jgi:hypothetical protein
MKIKNEDHRAFLLEAIKNCTIPGHLLDLASEVKAAVIGAEIESGLTEAQQGAADMLDGR